MTAEATGGDGEFRRSSPLRGSPLFGSQCRLHPPSPSGFFECNSRAGVNIKTFFAHTEFIFHHDVRRKRFIAHGESHIMEMSISKGHVAEKPRRGGTSGGMVTHDLVKAAEKVLWIA